MRLNIKDFRVTLPSGNERLAESEWDTLFHILGNKVDDKYLHCHGMYSWTEDLANCNYWGAENDKPYRFVRGFHSNFEYEMYSQSSRSAIVGFRPVFRPNDVSMLNGIADGEKVVIATLYMDGKPVPMYGFVHSDAQLSYGTETGESIQITSYLQKAKLEFREPLDDEMYQVTAYKAGNVLIASQCLLKNISWDDIHTNGFCTGTEIFSIKNGNETKYPLDLPAFYAHVAQEFGYHISGDTKFDCTRLLVSKNIQEQIFAHYYALGYDKTDVSGTWLLLGPKVDKTLLPNQVGVLPWFFIEEPKASEEPLKRIPRFDLEDAIHDLLAKSDKEVLENIAATFLREANEDELPYKRIGHAMLEAYRDGDVDAFCIALTGWSFENILKKAGAIEDYDNTFGD